MEVHCPFPSPKQALLASCEECGGKPADRYHSYPFVSAWVAESTLPYICLLLCSNPAPLTVLGRDKSFPHSGASSDGPHSSELPVGLVEACSACFSFLFFFCPICLCTQPFQVLIPYPSQHLLLRNPNCNNQPPFHSENSGEKING